MTKHEQQFRDTLSEILEMDKADLDFGIYRIMNAKREEINRFLDKELIPQVRKTLGEGSADLGQKEDDVFSHLYRFFRRYYDAGDFISKRRYKEGVYAIPYEGEEVKLYWANHDQYYIKSSENLMHYRFTLASGAKVAFRVVEAPQVTDNKKADGVRLLQLAEESPAVFEENELVIRFAWVLVSKTDKKKNEEVVKELAAAILKTAEAGKYKRELMEPAPSKAENKEKRTVLEKHLTGFISRHTFDYFIHKDLGGFLRRELDYYIKTEVMQLDNLDTEHEIEARKYLDILRAIKKVGQKIIALLAQLEDFQKKLWLKKKFVYETQYCFTLDRVPEELYPEIAANDAQREEWVRLFAIDEIKGDLTTPGYSAPLTVEFLKANPYLVLDTRHFSEDFKRRLLASFDDLDEQCDGLLIHSENFQALNLLMERYRGQVKCVYVDPPYNTVEGTFIYKNNYKHSSWVTMMIARVAAGGRLLEKGGVMEVAIDDTESSLLRMVLDAVYGPGNYVSTIAAEVNPAGQNLRPNAPARSHDYCHVYANDIDAMEMLYRPLTAEEEALYVERDERGPFLWDNLRRRGGNSRPIDRPNQWYPLYVNIEQRKVSLTPFEGSTEVWPIDPQGEKRIWRVSPEGAEREIQAGEISVIMKAGRPEVVKKTRMPEGKKPKTLWDDPKYSATTYGTKLLNNILGPNPFSYPKSVHLVKDCIRFWADESALVLDFFAGSGTTAHAVINLNREDGGRRKYILVEMGEYFDTVLVLRIKKVVYSKDWKDGKPLTPTLSPEGRGDKNADTLSLEGRGDKNANTLSPMGRGQGEGTGISHMFKYIRLESYEDTLNNLDIKGARDLFDKHGAPVPEDYVLHYMLDIETKDSASLLKAGYLKNPFDYQMKITRNNEMAWRKIDLVETFNWLLGLKVKKYHLPVMVHMEFGLSEDKRVVAKVKGSGGGDFRYQLIEGETLAGESVLICWRTLSGDDKTEQLRKDAAALEQFLVDQKIDPQKFDKFYVNGDSTVKGAIMIEPEFRRLMFADTGR